MTKEILVLGHKGMLGQMVCKYFTSVGCEVIINPYRFTEENRVDFLAFNQRYPDAVIINAIGRIKQKTSNEQDLLWANTVLPIALYENLSSEQILIHPSTDCVFSGIKNGGYKVEDNADAIDSYGWSKRLAEVALQGKKNVLVPRVSIIGPDTNDVAKGLIGWFLSQPEDAKLKGYCNHFWNGITTLEWCKQMDSLLKSSNISNYIGRPFQLGTREYYTKYEMLVLFRKVFEKKCEIEVFEPNEAIDRRLLPEIFTKSLVEQLQEIRNF